MAVLSRLIAALAYAGAAFLLGVLLGERGELGVVQQIFLAAIPAITVVMTFVARQGRAYVFATGLAMLLGLFLGQRQFERAWSECVTGGAVVRDALLRYHARHDGYPARLEDLDIELPCRCGFRRTILHYLSNERGFRLWITNDREAVHFDTRGSIQ